MGIKDLPSFLKKRKLLYTTSSDSLDDHKIAIDISILMYKFKYVARKDWITSYYNDNNYDRTSEELSNFELENENDIITNMWIESVINKLRVIEAISIIPIIIFDGDANINKLACNKRNDDRKKRKDILNGNECSFKEYFTTFSSNVCFDKEEVDLFKSKLKDSDFLYLQAEGEADFLCSKLYKKNLIDGVFSNDSDMLTHGCGVLITNISRLEVKFYVLEDILEYLKFTMEQFIDFCILCGCDYNTRVPLVGPAKALRYITDQKSIENINFKEPEHVKNLNVDLCRDIFGYYRYKNDFSMRSSTRQ